MCNEFPLSSPRLGRAERGRRSAVRAGPLLSPTFRAFRLLRPFVGEGVAHTGGGFRKGGTWGPPLRGALLVLFSRQGEKSTHIILPDKSQITAPLRGFRPVTREFSLKSTKKVEFFSDISIAYS